MKLEIRQESWPMRKPFHIAGQTFLDSQVVVAEVSDGPYRGRGEAAGVYYKGDTPQRIIDQLEALRGGIADLDRQALQTVLPAGGARNALDCALWELEAARAGQSVWQIAGLASVTPLKTVFTIGIDTPQAMAVDAQAMTHADALKLKLAGDGSDAARVQAVRAARPDVWLAVDANQGFDRSGFIALMPVLEEARVSLIEQPLAIGNEPAMHGIDRRIPIAADESIQDIGDLASLVGLFDVINIKLDKCGGLTHALQMEAEARRLGFDVMVGNMSGTSWAQAPAFVLGQRCDFIDLDGPTLLASDRSPAVAYVQGQIHCPDVVWGRGAE